ncbi:MAG: diacylglycerol/lipid kinase family protein [Fidelibacterota bacterium]
MRFLIIANPTGGKGKISRILPRVEFLLRQLGADFRIQRTNGPDHATAIARDEGEGFDVVVALGGDGTVNETVNGLVGSTTPLGIIPLGTANDFARSFGIPLSLEDSIGTLVRGKPKPIDLGVVNGRYFSNALGVGFDAMTSEATRSIRWLKGGLLYAWATLKTLSKYTAIPMRIELDDRVIEEDTYLVCVGNGSSVGGGLHLTPEAVMDDGVFHVCHIRDISPLKVVGNFLKLINGTVEKVDEVTIHQSRNVRITSEVPLPVHVDGELPQNEVTQMEVELIPKALLVIGNWTGGGPE